MAWRDFIDASFIALNVRHASGALSTILAFSLVGWVAGKVMQSGYILDGIHLAEKIVVSACIVYLTLAILWELSRRLVRVIKGDGNGAAILVP